MEQQKGFSDYIKFGIVLLFMFGFQFLPPFGPMTQYGMAVLGILIGAILGWSFDAKQMIGTSLIALVALAMVGYPGGITAVYQKLMASESLLMMCLAMVMVGALVDAKMDSFIIAKVMNMKFVQGKPWLTTFLLVFSPCILGLLIMNTPLMLFLLPLYIKLFKGAGYGVGDKYVINVFIGSIISAICSMYILPFKGIALAFSGMVRGYTGSMWTYAEFLLTLSITCLAISALYVVFMWIQRCDVSKVANLDLSVFGDPKAPITKHQKAVLWCMIAYIVGSTIISFGGMMQNAVGAFLNSISVYGWLLVIMGVMSVVKVDGQRLMNLGVATAKGFSWDLILMVGSATLIGGALTTAETGFGALLTGLVAPLFNTLGTVGIAIFMFAVMIIATNFCNNMAIMMIGFTILGSLIAGGMALNGPMLAAGIMLFSQIGILLPASSLWGAMLHSLELTTPSAIYKYAGLAIIYCIVVGCAVYIPLSAIVY